MNIRLLLTCFLFISAGYLSAQCSATNSAVLVVTTNTSMPGSGYFYVKVCAAGHAYDTSGSTGGRSYYLEAGGQLTLKFHSTTMVYAKSGSVVNIIGNGSTFLYYETGTTINGTASFPNNCPSVSFPASPSCVTGIKEEQFPVNFHVYPNPVKHKFTINNPGNVTGTGILLNALGQTVKSFTITEGIKDLDISGLAPGVYYLGFGPSAKTTSYKKIVIED